MLLIRLILQMKMPVWMNRIEFIHILSDNFFIYLQGQKIIFDNSQIAYNADREGRNKYLSNLDLSLKKKNKYLCGDWYSKEAYEKVKNNDFTNLVYEHMIPKNIYQNEIFKLNIANKLTKDMLFNILNKYWHIAIITKDQDKLLNDAKLRIKMPDNNHNNIFARYDKAGIKVFNLNDLNEK